MMKVLPKECSLCNIKLKDYPNAVYVIKFKDGTIILMCKYCATKRDIFNDENIEEIILKLME